MIDNISFNNYQTLISIDAIIKNLSTKYPYNLQSSAVFTQHQLKLYQSNYCFTENETTPEQPSVTGGGTIQINLY